MYGTFVFHHVLGIGATTQEAERKEYVTIEWVDEGVVLQGAGG